MADYVLVLILLYGNGEAFIDVSKPMPYHECSVMEASMYTEGGQEWLNSLSKDEYTLMWAVCREMKDAN